MHGAAGGGHQGRHAEFGEHVRGGLHLGGAAHRVLAGAVGDPFQGGGVHGGELDGDVLAQPPLVARGPRRVQGLHDRGGHPFVEHAAQELLAGGEPGRAVQHLDAGAERPEQGGVADGAGSAGQHRDAQSAPRHRGHHRHVGERDAGFARDIRQLPFGPWRGRVQVGPQEVPGRAVPGAALAIRAFPAKAILAQAGQPGLERLNRSLRAVDAQHQARSPRRLGFAGGVEDGPGRGYRRIVAADAHSRRSQVARDDRTGLAQAEYRDDQSLSVAGHHARG